MAFLYTQADLQTAMNAGVQGRQGILGSPQDTMNAAMRRLYRRVDLRSAKRKAVLAPNLFNGIFDYACPADLKAHAVIDVAGQASRADGELDLVTTEEFERLNGARTGTIAIDTHDGVRLLKVASAVDSDQIVASELDALTSGGGTWAAFGDGTNLAADGDDYIKGAGSLKWDISAAAGTTAGIANASLNAIDMTDYFGGTSAFFVWAKIASTTGLTSYSIRFGSDASNYYTKTVTAQSDGSALTAGWNLLRFDVSSLTETGTVVDSAIGYVALFMTKTSGKVSESDYKFDWLVLSRGVVSNVRYYGKYPWKDGTTGAYKENATSPTDVLVADTDEFDLAVDAAIAHARREIGFSEVEVATAEKKLTDAVAEYALTSPSEAKIMTSGYYDY